MAAFDAQHVACVARLALAAAARGAQAEHSGRNATAAAFRGPGGAAAQWPMDGTGSVLGADGGSAPSKEQRKNSLLRRTSGWRAHALPERPVFARRRFDFLRDRQPKSVATVTTPSEETDEMATGREALAFERRWMFSAGKAASYEVWPLAGTTWL